MRENFMPIGLACFFAVVLVMVAATLANRKKEEPCPVTPRLLDCDPDHFSGLLVSFKSAGFEPMDSPSEFKFRHQTDKPPIVLIRFQTAPDKLPVTVTGRCQGRQGDAVLVTDCR